MSKPQTKPRLIPAILPLILMVALASCRTLPSADARPDLPVIAWPAFPDPDGKVHRLDDGRVVMSTEYWLAITRYVIDVEAGIAEVEAWRAVK